MGLRNEQRGVFSFDWRGGGDVSCECQMIIARDDGIGHWCGAMGVLPSEVKT